MNKIIISRDKLKEWISNLNEKDSLMLTISEPHARIKSTIATGKNLEPIINQIINLANRYVYRKHKRFESLKGIVVEENYNFRPHYHIVFQKPENMDFEVFKHRLNQLSDKLCSEDFKFDLRDSFLSQIRNILSMPCYDKFSKVTNGHGFLGKYLTKSFAKYYLLNGRKFSRKYDDLDLRIEFGKIRNNLKMAI